MPHIFYVQVVKCSWIKSKYITSWILLFTSVHLFLHVIIFMLYTLLPTFKQFHKSVLIDMCILMMEMQPNCCFDFIIWCVIWSFKMLLHCGKYAKIWQCQVGAVFWVIQDGEIKVIISAFLIFRKSELCFWSFVTELSWLSLILRQLGILSLLALLCIGVPVWHFAMLTSTAESPLFAEV